MTIERLIRAIPPPALAAEAYNGPWEPIEAEIGIALPQDYKDFVRLYGSGYFMQFLGIYVPRSKNPNVRLERQVRQICDIFQQIGELAYPLWPNPGGLLPFGVTDNGDFLFWLTRGLPESWQVVVWDRGMQEFEALGCDLTDFLAGLSTGEILPREFPEELLPCDCLFKPHYGQLRRWVRLAAASPNNGAFGFTWRMGAYGAVSGRSTCRLRGYG